MLHQVVVFGNPDCIDYDGSDKETNTIRHSIKAHVDVPDVKSP